MGGRIGAVKLALTLLVGLYFLWVRGPGLLLVGIPSVLAVVLYTRWLTHDPLLCLLAPGIGFGPCMVMGVDFVLTGTYCTVAFTASILPFFLVSNLLLITQFPDIEPDAGVGRRHLMIAYGKRAGVIVYGVFLLGAYLSVVIAWLAGWLPATSLAALITAPLAAHTAAGVAKHHNSGIEALLPYMKKKRGHNACDASPSVRRHFCRPFLFSMTSKQQKSRLGYQKRLPQRTARDQTFSHSPILKYRPGIFHYFAPRCLRGDMRLSYLQWSFSAPLKRIFQENGISGYLISYSDLCKSIIFVHYLWTSLMILFIYGNECSKFSLGTVVVIESDVVIYKFYPRVLKTQGVNLKA